MVITDKKELAIWLTDTPFNKKSGVWTFYDSLEDYEFDLGELIHKYRKKNVLTLSKVQKLYKDRGFQEDDE